MTIPVSMPEKSAFARNPLDMIAHDHMVQVQLCDAMEKIADGLPDDVARAVLATQAVMAAGHRPGFHHVADQAALDAEKAWAEGVAWKTNAWKSKDRVAVDSEAACEDAMPRRGGDQRSAYDQYVARTSQAWRGGA
jgi:hypothetical protein